MKKIIAGILIILSIFTLVSCKSGLEERKDGIDSRHIGYIELDGNKIKIDDFEFIKSEDKKRIKELGLKEEDMPNGYYIYDKSDEVLTFDMDEKIVFTFYDTGNIFVNEEDDKEYKTDSVEEFKKFLYGGSEIPRRMPFWIELNNDKVISVVEEFVN